MAYSYYPYFNSDNTRVMCGVVDGFYKLKVWDWNAATMARSNGVVMPQFSGGIQFTDTQFSHLDTDKIWCSVASSTLTSIYSYKPSTQASTLVKDFKTYISANYGANAYLFQLSVSDDDIIFAGHIVNGTTRGYIVATMAPPMSFVHRKVLVRFRSSI